MSNEIHVADLLVFGGVFEDEIGALVTRVGAPIGPSAPLPAELKLLVALEARAALSGHRVVGTPFQDWLLDRLLDDVSPVARILETLPLDRLSPILADAATADLRTLWRLLSSGEASRHPVTDIPEGDVRSRTKQRLLGSDAEGALAILAGHYARGLGIFGRYRAFRWKAGKLEGIADFDPIRLETLVQYEAEREPVVTNTRQLLAGRPANDVLLYGARGTGKSSTVKAIVNEFADEGLRIVEVTKDSLLHLAEILPVLRGRHERFIIYVDDLSFEDEESQYKELKALLEGTAEARPSNVVVYATSNRRNLITQRWGERAPGDEEVNPKEKLEEKLSLADRFGIRAAFPAPDQVRYLQIVESLANGAGISMPRAELRQAAIRWEMMQTGRSARTARQFVIWLQGRQGVA